MVATMQRRGASPAIDNITALLEKSKIGYEDCSDASGGYKDLRKEVKNLHNALRDLKEEYKDQSSELNRGSSQYGAELASLVAECDATLESLLALIDEYFRRRRPDTESLRLRPADLDQIGNQRIKLINCKMWVQAILEKIGKEEQRTRGRGQSDDDSSDLNTSSSRARQEPPAPSTPQWLDDNFRVGSWNNNGLAESGYSRAMIRVPEPEITTTDMILWDDVASERTTTRQLPGRALIRDVGRPRVPSDDIFTGGSPAVKSPISSARSSVSFNEGTRPRLVANTSGSGHNLRPDSQDGNVYGVSPRASGESLYGSSPRASGAALFGSSPAVNVSGGIYGQSPRASLAGLAGRSSFSDGGDRSNAENIRSSGLQPDQEGRPIPASAQWTKVNRRLVSPEVLEGRGYRYEARENYVAILGVLTREQLQDLADRTVQARASRSRRSRGSRDIRPTSRGSNDATPTPANFSQPPSDVPPSPGVPPQVQHAAPKPQAVPLKPILKNKSVRFDDDDLKGSDLETSETSTSDSITESDTDTSSDRRRIDPRDSRRSSRSGRDDRDSKRDRDRGDRHRSAPMGHGRAQPMPINPSGKQPYMTVPSGGHGSGDGRRNSHENESRGNSYDSRDGRDQTPKGGRQNGNNWKQKATAGGLGAMAGTFLSLATDVLIDGFI